MEIIINKCWGGFGLSNEAVLELIRMKSKIVKKMTIKEYYGGNNPRFSKDWENEYIEDKKRHELFKNGYYQDKYYSGIIYKEPYVFSVDREDSIRNNPDLIKVVKKLKDKANGSHAELRIVEIPDGTDFEIDDYDGMESVEEKHRSWG